MKRRKLSFSTYDDVVAELERLERVRYQQLCQWNLGCICRHLPYYFRGSLEGFGFQLPWVVRKLLGRPLLRRYVKARRFPTGARTIPASVPESDTDERTAVAEAKQLLERLAGQTGELYPSPLVNRLTADEWRTLHVMHAAHHLSFLIPNEPESRRHGTGWSQMEDGVAGGPES